MIRQVCERAAWKQAPVFDGTAVRVPAWRILEILDGAADAEKE